MSRTLYWKPHKPNEMQPLNKSIPLMDAIYNCYGCGEVILTKADINKLFFLACSLGFEEAKLINEVINLIDEHNEIELEIRR